MSVSVRRRMTLSGAPSSARGGHLFGPAIWLNVTNIFANTLIDHCNGQNGGNVSNLESTLLKCSNTYR
jgi:hypothetical protein